MKCVLSLGSESAKTKGHRASYMGRDNVISVLKENSNSVEIKNEFNFKINKILFVPAAPWKN